jgi:soluble lytic murein transglycosylase-like protein
MAEAELLRLDPGNDTKLETALLAYANHAGLPALALRLGNALSTDAQGRYYDAALYPTGAWPLKDGYKIDAALVHAIMRQESRFDPSAESPSGAKGLMQLMPATARYVARREGLKDRYRNMEALDDPQVNLEIGQRYLASLLEDPYVQDDLLSLLIAYNAGPGNLARWKKQWPDVRDPLLFIELIPATETRTYVERVLSNYWIYRMREGAPTLTLDAVVAGRPARYALATGEGQAIYRLASSRP